MTEKIEILSESELMKLFKSGKLRSQGDVNSLVKELTGKVLDRIARRT